MKNRYVVTGTIRANLRRERSQHGGPFVCQRLGIEYESLLSRLILGRTRTCSAEIYSKIKENLWHVAPGKAQGESAAESPVKSGSLVDYLSEVIAAGEPPSAPDDDLLLEVLSEVKRLHERITPLLRALKLEGGSE